MEIERRESLARRNKESANHARVMEELRSLEQDREHESMVLKWAGEEDAKAYIAKLKEERRKSLELRGKAVVLQRQLEDQQRSDELQRQHEDAELRRGEQKDVEAYQKECADRKRASFQYRLKEARIQRLEEEERRQQQQDLDDANFQLETLARTDVEEYIRDCKARRRMSLALRAKEKRRHAKYYRQQADEEREAQSRLVRDRLMDQRHVELARQKERAEAALEAVRHAGCSFNPFANVYH